MLYIINGKVVTMEGPVWGKGYVCIEEGKIKELGPMEEGAPFLRDESVDTQIIDATGCIVMPGLIEAHCRMGITEEKKGMEGDDCNECVNPITPYLRAIDAINPMDAAFIVKTTQYFVPMGDNIDKEAEIAKLEKDLAYQQGFLATVMKKLSNERFVSSAPQKVVETEYAKKRDAEAKIAAIREQLTALK